MEVRSKKRGWKGNKKKKKNGKWRVKRHAEKRRRKGREGGEEGGGKERVRGVGGGWWGYDELKMTLSGSLVSKDHSVC